MDGSPTRGLQDAHPADPDPARRRTSTSRAVLAGLLLVLAGWLSILAAGLRWDPACSDGFDAAPCVLIQDHRYDYLLPTEPWDPIPGAAELAGASWIGIGLALALVCAAVRSAAWVRALQALLVLSVLFLGVITVLSGRAGVPIEPATGVAEWLMPVWMVAGPMALVVLFTHWATGPVDDRLMPGWTWALWAVLLVLAMPFPEYFVISLVAGYTSYDTTPWTGAASGMLVALAGVVMIVGVVMTAVRWGRTSLPRGRPAASATRG